MGMRSLNLSKVSPPDGVRAQRSSKNDCHHKHGDKDQEVVLDGERDRDGELRDGRQILSQVVIERRELAGPRR